MFGETSRRTARAMRGSPLIRGLAQKRSCNRKERRNQTTFVRTRGGEFAGVLEPGRLRAQTFHRHRRAPSSGCLPSERLKAKEDLEDSATKLLAHGQRDRARSFVAESSKSSFAFNRSLGRQPLD